MPTPSIDLNQQLLTFGNNCESEDFQIGKDQFDEGVKQDWIQKPIKI